MEHNDIEQLLNRYLEGESTLEEEALLKEYFKQDNLPQEHSQLQELFRFLDTSKHDAAPSFDVTSKLNTLIDNAWESESKRKFSSMFAWVGSTAAVLIISFGMFQYLNKSESVIKDTYQDPKLAYIETKKALLLISKTMNKSTAQLSCLSKVDKSLNQIRKISEIDRVVSSVKSK